MLKVPADLQATIGKEVIVQSLRTRDLSTAQKARWPLVAEWFAAFDVARGKREWTPSEIEAKARQAYEETLATLQDAGSDEQDTELFRDVEIEAAERASERAPQRDLEQALSVARVAAATGRLAAMRGEVPEPPATFGRNAVDLRTLKPVAARKAEAGERFSEVARKYVEEVQRDVAAKLTEQTKGQYKAAYRLFAQWAEDPALGCGLILLQARCGRQRA